MSATPLRRVRVTVTGKTYTVVLGALNANPSMVSVNG